MQQNLIKQKNWLQLGFSNAVKAYDAFFYYLLYISGTLAYILGMITVLGVLFVEISPKLLFGNGLPPEEAWQIGAFIGLPVAAFFVFKCAAKLMVWRMIESYQGCIVCCLLVCHH